MEIDMTYKLGWFGSTCLNRHTTFLEPSLGNENESESEINVQHCHYSSSALLKFSSSFHFIWFRFPATAWLAFLSALPSTTSRQLASYSCLLACLLACMHNFIQSTRSSLRAQKQRNNSPDTSMHRHCARSLKKKYCLVAWKGRTRSDVIWQDADNY